MAVHINRSQTIAKRLVKLRDYLYTNASPAHAVKTADMIAYLANERYKVEIKTVYSDLKILETYFGLDLQYDGRQRGYLLKNPPFEPYELRLIVNSIQAAKFITQQEADRLTTKIMRELADKYTRQSLKRRTFIKNRAHTINEEAMKGLDTIYEAIAKDRKISYRYFLFTGDKDDPKQYIKKNGSKVLIASPYRVLWTDSSFLILGVEKTSGNDRPSMLQLDHMEQVKILKDKRDVDVNNYSAGWDIIEKYGRNASSSSPARMVQIKSPKFNATIIADKFGANTMMRPLDEDFLIATIDIEPIPMTMIDLYIWTMRFRPRIEIVFPVDAESKLREFFSELSKGKQILPPHF